MTPATAKNHPSETRRISLKPSTSDYPTFVETTIKSMNLTGPVRNKRSPNRFVLALTRSASTNGPVSDSKS